MLPKTHRIDKDTFKAILLNSKRHNSYSYTLYISPIPKGGKSRFSFSVSKKVEKSAVKRNKLRRRGYSILSRNIKNIKSGYLVLFVYKKNYEKDYKKLESELLGLLSNAYMII